MRNANHVLDEFAATVQSTSQGVALKAPWSKTHLSDDGQAAAVAMIKSGAIGLAGQPGRYKLYAWRKMAGNPFARMLSGWFIYALVIALFAALLWLGVNGRSSQSSAANFVGLGLSIIGACYFSFHSLHAWNNSWLLKGLGRIGEVTRLGACTWASVTCIACVAGFTSRLL